VSETTTIRRGERCRIYPENGQPGGFRKIGGACRLLHNVALEQRRTYSRRGRYIGYHEQAAQLAELKEAYPFFAEVPHHCLQQVLRDLDTAFQRFFKGQAGYPKPKRKRDGGDSFRFPDPAQFRIWVGDNGNAWLTLPKFGKRKDDLGEIRMRMHRPLPPGARVKSITISQEAEWWYASLNYEAEVNAPVPHLGEAVGGDMGVAVPLMLSTGETFDVPKQTERELERLRRLEKSLARKKRGSRNREKARRALARHHAKVRRRRRDALRKIAATVAKNHGFIVLEDLNVKNMTASASGTVEEPGTNVAQKAGLNRAILEIGWYTLYLFLKEAAEKHGGRVLLVPPHHTSQTCPDPKCGHVSPANRAERSTFACVACGHEGHADHVAAKNILARGLEMVQAEADESQSAKAAKPRKQKTSKKTVAGGLPAPACGDLGAARSAKQEGRPARAGGSELHP